MIFRFCFFLIIAGVFSSCDTFSVLQDKELKSIDTIVDFSSVDVSPTFASCDSLIAKEKQTRCFRSTMQQQIAHQLSTFSLAVKAPIDEMITVIIFINREGQFYLSQLRTTPEVIAQLPKLDSILNLAVKRLPKVYPALKRGIPVATQYELPIRIKVEE